MVNPRLFEVNRCFFATFGFLVQEGCDPLDRIVAKRHTLIRQRCKRSVSALQMIVFHLLPQFHSLLLGDALVFAVVDKLETNYLKSQRLCRCPSWSKAYETCCPHQERRFAELVSQQRQLLLEDDEAVCFFETFLDDRMTIVDRLGSSNA